MNTSTITIPEEVRELEHAFPALHDVLLKVEKIDWSKFPTEKAKVEGDIRRIQSTVRRVEERWQQQLSLINVSRPEAPKDEAKDG